MEFAMLLVAAAGSLTVGAIVSVRMLRRFIRYVVDDRGIRVIVLGMNVWSARYKELSCVRVVPLGRSLVTGAFRNVSLGNRFTREYVEIRKVECAVGVLISPENPHTFVENVRRMATIHHARLSEDSKHQRHRAAKVARQ